MKPADAHLIRSIAVQQREIGSGKTFGEQLDDIGSIVDAKTWLISLSIGESP
jgi:hypothetical protein